VTQSKVGWLHAHVPSGLGGCHKQMQKQKQMQMQMHAR
jgi:hypothetical protein